MPRIALVFLVLFPWAAAQASSEMAPEQRLVLIERAVDDIMLRIEVNARLRADPELREAGFAAEIRRGVVEIKGNSGVPLLIQRAIGVAETVRGVAEVRHTPGELR